MKLKHGCPLPVVWMSSVEALLLVLETALPSMLKSKGQSLCLSTNTYTYTALYVNLPTPMILFGVLKDVPRLHLYFGKWRSWELGACQGKRLLKINAERCRISCFICSGGEELEFWRELAAILEDFLFNEVYVKYLHIHVTWCVR